MADKAKVYDLAEVIKREVDKVKPIRIKAGSKTFEVPPTPLWPDAAFVAAAKADDNDPMSVVELSKILLGKDYDAWVKAGGNAMLFFTIITEHNGASLPEPPASTDS